MHMVAPHAFAAVFRQQGGVEVDHLMGIGIDQVVGNERQPSCQYDESDVVLPEEGHHHVRIIQVCFGNNGSRHFQPLCPHQCISIGLVTDDQGRVYQF